MRPILSAILLTVFFLPLRMYSNPVEHPNNISEIQVIAPTQWKLELTNLDYYVWQIDKFWVNISGILVKELSTAVSGEGTYHSNGTELIQKGNDLDGVCILQNFK